MKGLADLPGDAILAVVADGWRPASQAPAVVTVGGSSIADEAKAKGKKNKAKKMKVRKNRLQLATLTADQRQEGMANHFAGMGAEIFAALTAAREASQASVGAATAVANNSHGTSVAERDTWGVPAPPLHGSPHGFCAAGAREEAEVPAEQETERRIALGEVFDEGVDDLFKDDQLLGAIICDSAGQPEHKQAKKMPQPGVPSEALVSSEACQPMYNAHKLSDAQLPFAAEAAQREEPLFEDTQAFSAPGCLEQDVEAESSGSLEECHLEEDARAALSIYLDTAAADTEVPREAFAGDGLGFDELQEEVESPPSANEPTSNKIDEFESAAKTVSGQRALALFLINAVLLFCANPALEEDEKQVGHILSFLVHDGITCTEEHLMPWLQLLIEHRLLVASGRGFIVKTVSSQLTAPAAAEGVYRGLLGGHVLFEDWMWFSAGEDALRNR